uniref:IRG-type G domain-containing protein n=1 Tax=Astyanax mexicanus TaxID=7994 RepID=A0A3B1IYV2_ASTMX
MCSDSDTNNAIRASGESTLKRAKKKAQQQFEHLFNVSLNIAVTGETGVGKSTFINAYRHLNDDDEGAAETGVTETTAEPTPYEHPTIPNVVLWDLPGVGTPNFKVKTYVKKIQIDRFDFFIIISSVRFKENEIMLAKEIQKRKKKFYFIRSKIDNDIDSERKRRKRKKTFNIEETLSKIRRDCQENLKELGNPPVFLISSWNLSAFDFEELVSTLNSELPEHKQYALLQSVPITSMAMLEKKVAVFKKLIWAAAIVSGGIAAAPVPGLSFACDTAIVISFFTRCYHAFGLDDRSLKKLSERVNKPELKDWKKSPLLNELRENLCKLIPCAGSVAAAAISFTMTRDLLERGLKALADEARMMLSEAGLV